MNLKTFFLPILGSFSLVNAGMAAEPWNSDNFKITDAPWVEVQQFGLYLDADNTLHQSNNNAGYINSFYMAGKTSEQFWSNQTNLLPEFKYLLETKPARVKVRLPFSFSYNASMNATDAIYYYPDKERIAKVQTQYQALNMRMTPSVDLDFYFDPFFLGWEATVDGEEKNYQSLSKSENFSSAIKREEETYHVALTQLIRSGVGRIVEANYTYQAMQLVDELQQAQVLKKPITAADLSQLSKIVTCSRQVFMFDDRLKTMKALKTILEYLIVQGYIAAGDLQAFLLVDDIYRNVYKNSRPFGWQANTRLGAAFRLNNTENKTYFGDGLIDRWDRYELLYNDMYVGVELQYELPIDRQWQIGMDGFLDYYIWKDIRYMVLDKQPALSGEANARLDYYLDTRSKIGLSTGVQWNYELRPFIHDDNGFSQEIAWCYQKKQVKATLALNARHQLNFNCYLDAQIGVNLEVSQRNHSASDGSYAYEPEANDLTTEQINQLNDKVYDVSKYHWDFRFGIHYQLL